MGRDADGRADVYRVGLLCYELIAGTHPFTDEAGIEFAYAHAKSPSVPLRARGPDVDARLAELVDALIDKVPARRPPTPADVIARLKGAVPGV